MQTELLHASVLQELFDLITVLSACYLARIAHHDERPLQRCLEENA